MLEPINTYTNRHASDPPDSGHKETPERISIPGFRLTRSPSVVQRDLGGSTLRFLSPAYPTPTLTSCHSCYSDSSCSRGSDGAKGLRNTLVRSNRRNNLHRCRTLNAGALLT
jgi:hypothetical protein